MQAALETLSAEAAIAIENARLYREALDKAKIEQELKVAAAIQQSLLPPGDHSGAILHGRRRIGAVPVGRRRFLRLHRLSDGPLRLHPRRHRGQGVAGGAPGRRGARHVQRGGDVSDRVVRRPSRASTRALFRRAIEARFLTAFYGILDADGSLTYTTPATTRRYLMSKTGVRRLEAGGVVLGSSKTATFEQETVVFDAGD